MEIIKQRKITSTKTQQKNKNKEIIKIRKWRKQKHNRINEINEIRITSYRSDTSTTLNKHSEISNQTEIINNRKKTTPKNTQIREITQKKTT